MRFIALRKAMIDAGGVTQKQIADKLGITENTMSLKMNGGSKFTRDQMIVIQRMLGNVSLDDLFSDEHASEDSAAGGVSNERTTSCY